MTVNASPMTAVLSGAWTGVGMTAIEAWEQQHPQEILVHNVLWLGGMIVFVFAPILLFVIGRQYLLLPGSSRWRVHDFHDSRIRDFWRRYWKDYPKAVLRMLCWFVGAGTGAVLYSVLRDGRWPLG